jgi:hypothetical protein
MKVVVGVLLAMIIALSVAGALLFKETRDQRDDLRRQEDRIGTLQLNTEELRSSFEDLDSRVSSIETCLQAATSIADLQFC